MITEEKVREALREVIDPEVGVNVVDLGLVYAIRVRENRISVDMTMTTRACPLVEHIKDQAEAVIKEKIPEAGYVEVLMVWDPPWNPDMMSEEARKKLGRA